MNYVGVHARHGVFVRLVGSLAREDVHLRIVGHHALIHAVERQTLSVRTPESAFIDAKLVSVYGLPIHNLTTAIDGQLVLLALRVNDIQLMVLDDCCGFRTAFPFVVLVVGKRTDVFACLLIDEETPLLIDSYQFVAPPGIPLVLGLQGLIAFTTEIQFFEGKEVFLLCAHHKR